MSMLRIKPTLEVVAVTPGLYVLSAIFNPYQLMDQYY